MDSEFTFDCNYDPECMVDSSDGLMLFYKEVPMDPLTATYLVLSVYLTVFLIWSWIRQWRVGKKR